MAQLIQPGGETPLIPQRGGVSPIGTSNPNTGSAANTNSTYGQGAFASGIAEPAVLFYTLQNTDYQGIVLFDTDSSINVTLNSAVQSNFTCAILNLDSGPMTLTPTLGYMVNGSPSLAMAPHQGANVFFANRAWTAFVGATIIPAVPNFADSEVVAGSGTAWVLAHTPAAGCVPVVVVQVDSINGSVGGGLVLLKGQNPGFSIAGVNITTTNPYAAGHLYAWYRF